MGFNSYFCPHNLGLFVNHKIWRMIEIREAAKSQAAEIARLIMMAMTTDCCLYFCGEGYGLEDFREMMTLLVEREDSQYSYQNTLVAMDADRVVGISVSYDGGRLHQLRSAFVEAAKAHIGKDHSAMAKGYCPEAVAGNQATGQSVGLALCRTLG